MRTLGFSLLLVAFAAGSLHWDWWRSIDRFVYDTTINLAAPPLDDRIVIVGIDEQTLAVKGRWPWNRALQAELIAKIGAGNPAALFVDIIYSGNALPDQDKALAAALAIPKVSALPVIFDSLSLRQPLIEVLPNSELLSVVDVLGHVHIELDDDSISRGTYLYQGVGQAYWPHVALALARQLGLATSEEDPEVTACRAGGEYSLQNKRCAQVLVPFAGAPGTIPELSALALMERSVPSSILDGKIVFLGLTASGVADWVTSPVSGESRPISGVEYNANVLNAVIQDRLVQPAPAWLIWLIALCCVLCVALLLPRTSPKAMLVVASLGALVPLLFSALALVFYSSYLPLAAASITSLLAYPLWSWRRHEVAWRFLDGEISRLRDERLLLASVNTSLPGARSSERQAQAVAKLLDAQLVEANAVDTPAQAPVLVAGGLSWIDEGQQQFLLRREEPFTRLERSLVEDLVSLPDPDAALVEPLPGESLAAKVRELKLQAEVVRLGRDIGLQGLERMASGVCVVSALGEVLFTNSALRNFVDATGEEAEVSVFSLLEPLVPPLGKTWVDIWQDVVRNGATVGFESPLGPDIQCFVYCAPLAETSLVTTLPLAMPLLDESDASINSTWLVTVTDTSEVRIAQRRRDEALAFLSHDLRSPISSILSLVRSWSEKSHHQPPSEQAYAGLLATIETYAQKSLSVSEQFLQLSRLEAQSQFETYELDLVQVVGNAADQLYLQAQDAKISIKTADLHRFEDGLWVQGNGDLLERAFVNLLGNALKYSEAGTCVEIQINDEAEQVSVSIKDAGAGIPAEELPQLFDPYFRSNDPDLAAKRGAGLGLRFVKTVAERHEGEVKVVSEPGVGSTFTVQLPRLAELSDL